MKASVWKSGGGKWHCACTDDLANNSGNSYILARCLGMKPAEYILWVVNNFNYDSFYVSDDYSLFYFVFKTESQARYFMKEVNKRLKKKGY